jgi:hypothetical protein
MGCRRQLIGAVSPNANAAATRQSPIIIWRTEKKKCIIDIC